MQDNPPARWPRFHAAMVEWGVKHAFAFITQVNDALRTTLMVSGTKKPIDEACIRGLQPNPKPPVGLENIEKIKAYILNTKTNVKTMDQVQNELKLWDKTVSELIQGAIYDNPDVREKLRKFVRGEK